MQGRNYILAAQPHGFLSMCGIYSAVKAEKEFRGTIPTGAVLRSPMLKHVIPRNSYKKEASRVLLSGTQVALQKLSSVPMRTRCCIFRSEGALSNCHCRKMLMSFRFIFLVIRLSYLSSKLGCRSVFPVG